MHLTDLSAYRILYAMPASPARDWRDHPVAAALLKTIVQRPPPRAAFAYRWCDTETRWCGRRVRSLRAVHRLAEPPIDTPEWRAWLAQDEQAAIAAALAGRDAL